MNEELEYLISQYADGTLGDEATRTLEARLAGDAEARTALDAHRRLIGLLRDLPMPAGVQWDRLGARIERSIAAAPDPAEVASSYRLFTGRFAWGAVGLAASVMIAAGVAIRMLGGGDGVAPIVPHAEQVAIKSFAKVVGPRAEVAIGPAMSEVSIGPGKAMASRGGPNIYGDLVSRPATVLVASGAPATDDTPQPPF
jgi:anti-sigma factor RsiW